MLYFTHIFFTPELNLSSYLRGRNFLTMFFVLCLTQKNMTFFLFVRLRSSFLKCTRCRKSMQFFATQIFQVYCRPMRACCYYLIQMSTKLYQERIGACAVFKSLPLWYLPGVGFKQFHFQFTSEPATVRPPTECGCSWCSCKNHSALCHCMSYYFCTSTLNYVHVVSCPSHQVLVTPWLSNTRARTGWVKIIRYSLRSKPITTTAADL